MRECRPSTSGDLQRSQERNQRCSLPGLKRPEAITGAFCFTTMPENRLLQTSRPSIVKKEGMAVEDFCQSDAPEWGCPPFKTGCPELRPAIGESFIHVMRSKSL
jgi:hypothetical protein